MLKYIHPQGATAIVYPDGSLAAFDKTGKAKKTSATAEKLARGHGGWVLVEGEVDHAALAEVVSAREPIPNDGQVRIPMKFKNGRIEDLPRYIADDNYVIQQKIDGIRAQIVFDEGATGCWVRSNSGIRLKSSASAPTVAAIEKAYADVRAPKYDYCIDGEIVNGVFWAFDVVSDNLARSPFIERHRLLTTWIEDQPTDIIVLLPTAITAADKRLLVDRVYENNGEGFIVKQKRSQYTWAGRVEHSLKVKLVDTADCFVTSVHETKDSISIAVYQGTNVVEIGRTSTIGKGTFKVGDVVEVQYLYAGAGGKLVQPTILHLRTDKRMQDCRFGQLKFVNKEVVV